MLTHITGWGLTINKLLLGSMLLIFEVFRGQFSSVQVLKCFPSCLGRGPQIIRHTYLPIQDTCR